MTSGSGLATSLGWQHLTAIEPELPSTTSSHRRERKTPPLNNLTELHESLAKVVLGNRDLVEVLTEITRIARREMPSIEAASVTLIRGEKPFTAAYDGQMALDADELQYERGYGPCMDAGRTGQVLLIDDMRTEQRWPDYAQHARRSRCAQLAFGATTVPRRDNWRAQYLRQPPAVSRRPRC